MSSLNTIKHILRCIADKLKNLASCISCASDIVDEIDEPESDDIRTE